MIFTLSTKINTLEYQWNHSSMFNVFFFPNIIEFHYILQKVFRYQHLEWYFCTSYCFLWTPKEPWKCFLLAWWVIMSTCFIMIFGHTNSATTLTPPPTALPVIHPRRVFNRVVVEFIHVIVYRFTISYKLSFNFFPQGIYIYISLSNLMLANLANIYHVCIILSLQCLSPL